VVEEDDSVDTVDCAHTEGSVDTLGQSAPASPPKKKQRRRTIKERRDIVEETLVPGASVARVARRNEVNANQVFYWRKLYREGRLGISIATPLLPVKVKPERPIKTLKGDSMVLSSGTMEVKLLRGTLRIAGSVDVLALRAVLECLAE
jgi:transposase